MLVEDNQSFATNHSQMSAVENVRNGFSNRHRSNDPRARATRTQVRTVNQSISHDRGQPVDEGINLDTTTGTVIT